MAVINKQLCSVCLLGVIFLFFSTATSHPYNETISPGFNTGGDKNVLELDRHFHVKWQGKLQTQDSLTDWSRFVRRQRRSPDETQEDKDPTENISKKPSGSSMLNVNMHLTVSCTLCAFILFIVFRFC